VGTYFVNPNAKHFLVFVTSNVNYLLLVHSTLASSTLIILFSDTLKLFLNNFQRTKLCERKWENLLDYFGILYFEDFHEIFKIQNTIPNVGTCYVGTIVIVSTSTTQIGSVFLGRAISLGQNSGRQFEEYNCLF
jgi:hypothetical protein